MSKPIPEAVLDDFASMRKKFKHYYDDDYGLVSVQSDDVHLTYEAFITTFLPAGDVRMKTRTLYDEMGVEEDLEDMWTQELWAMRDGVRFFCLVRTKDVAELQARLGHVPGSEVL